MKSITQIDLTAKPTGGLSWQTSESELGQVLGLSPERLTWLCENAAGHYTEKTFVKANGTIRTCYAPSGTIRQPQRWIKEWLDRLALHSAAHGWRKGKSCRSAASPHVGKDIVITIDIVSFFPSITHHRVYQLFVELGCSADVSRKLTQLTTHAGHLAQGLTTSPVISNLIMRRTDVRIHSACKQLGYAYTRYGDDITVSGGFTNARRAYNTIIHILKKCGYKVNKEKLEKGGIQTRHQSQQTLGLTVNQRPNLTRARRRELRAAVHNRYRDGAVRQLDDGEQPDHLQRKLQGRICHLSYINPAAAKSLKTKHSATNWHVGASVSPTTNC